MPERLSNVYEIPDWLAEKFPALTGPVRAASNTALLPVDAGADLLRRGVHGALGLEESEPGKFSGERVDKIRGALEDTMAPVNKASSAVQGGITNALDYMRKSLIESGAREKSTPPQAAAAPDAGLKISPQIEGEYGPGPSTPAMKAARDALPGAGQYDTKLSPQEEVAFQQWKTKYAPDDSGDDYDLRGAFKAGLTPDPKTQHWPDTFKKPNHPTFSNESQYAKDAPDRAGRWEGDTFIPPKTESAITFLHDGRYVLIPTVVGGKQMKPEDAIRAWDAGQNPEIGMFKSREEADRAAQKTSQRGAQVRTADAGGTAQQGGVITTSPWEGLAGASAQQNGALEEGTPAAVAAAPRQNMAELFKQRIDAIEKDTGRKLSDQDKNELQLDFFLRMVQSGGKPGATLLSSAADSGLATSALSREMRERNTRDATARRKDSRDDAFREITLLDKDQDNVRADKREDTRLKLLERQINQGKWKVLDNRQTGTYQLLDSSTGQTKDTGIPVGRDIRDTRPAELQLLDHLKAHPEDVDILARIRGRDKENDDGKSIFEAATRRVTGDITGKMDYPTAIREAQEALGSARGGQTNLPKGVPKGSKKIGTATDKSGVAKDVYEGPDGRRYKVE